MSISLNWFGFSTLLNPESKPTKEVIPNLRHLDGYPRFRLGRQGSQREWGKLITTSSMAYFVILEANIGVIFECDYFIKIKNIQLEFKCPKRSIEKCLEVHRCKTTFLLCKRQ